MELSLEEYRAIIKKGVTFQVWLDDVARIVLCETGLKVDQHPNGDQPFETWYSQHMGSRQAAARVIEGDSFFEE
jgi:transposase